MGNVIQGGVGQAPARQAALKAGIPATVSALTINKVCGSGLKAVMLAAQSIKAGDRQVVVAGGQESMSNAPYYNYGMRGGVKLGDQTLVDGMIRDGLWCAFCDVHMGGHAEYTAKKAGVTRQMQDDFAAKSHQKAIAAIESGKFKDEIVPVEIPGKKGPTVVDTDESPRKDTTAESLTKLRPAFPSKDGKNDDLSVTAGNASSLNDGASALVVTSEEYARAHGLKILARIDAYATGATEPRDLFFAPIIAVQNLMKKSGSKIGDFDLIEANEAFRVASPRRRPGPLVELGPRQRQRRRHRPRPSDRRQRRARPHHASIRSEGSQPHSRARHAVPWRRRCRCPQRVPCELRPAN